MSRLAVSFCNQSAPSPTLLAVVDTASGEHRNVALPVPSAISASGLACDGEGNLYCAYSDGEGSFCVVFDAAIENVLNAFQLYAVRDVHSIVLGKSVLVAASTGSDEIVSMDIQDGHREVLWRASGAEQDTHHVNGLAWHNGNLYCSGFGAKVGPTWADAVDGFIYDVSEQRYVMRGLYHPHSLATFDHELFWCESAEGKVSSRGSDALYVPGYTRGLAFEADGTCYVGTSRARRSSDAPHLFLNPADDGMLAGNCELHVTNLRTRERSHISLDDLASEIYDIVVLAR